MSTMSERAGVIAFVTVLASLTNAATALAELPEHRLVVEFFDGDVDALPPGEFADFGFGEAVAIRDDVAFIGVPGARDNGHVIVLNLTPAGWAHVQTLTAPNPSAGAFGSKLTFRDGVLVVGGAGAAYVFKRGTRLFRFTQTLTPPAADGVNDFPVALRYEGGTLLASGFRSRAPSVVYVFERDSTTGLLVRRGKVKASDGTAGDSFGTSISMTSRLFVVGAPSADAAYTFRRNSSGNWVQAQKLVPSVPGGFGTAVAIDRDMILVGAPVVEQEGGASGGAPTPDDHVAGGAVYGFLPGISGYIESFKLRPRPDERFEYERFGSAIAMSGARIAVTATGFAPPVRIQPEGLVFTYTRNGSSVLARGITSRQGPVTSMGLSNNALLIGAFIDQESCRFVCFRVARIYDDNLFEQ